MRRVILLCVVLLLAAGSAYAAVHEMTAIEAKYTPFMDWFSAEEAMKAEVPEGLSEREAEIYREAYAIGHYSALHPVHYEDMYVLNTSSGKFHYSDCINTLLIDTKNREHRYETKEQLVAQGFKPCGTCKP